MTTFHYAPIDTELLVTSLRPEGRIFVAESGDSKSLDRATRVALMSLRLARRLGIETPSESVRDAIPYSESNHTVTYPAPCLAALVQREAYFLRGWPQFQGCIKGFNALGLMAEHVHNWIERWGTRSPDEALELQREFLAAKGLSGSSTEFDESLEILDLAMWHCFAKRPIVCSTSSNMGISLHEILRLMQATRGTCTAGGYTILSESEGRLVIWCPDERADFMNAEKARLLRALESEQPPLTRLRTYINRQQRDPGAIRDALTDGGYFFPTNPQSAQELQSLLYGALIGDSSDAEESIRSVTTDANALTTLASLGCHVDMERMAIEVRRGIEGGIHGLMVPYWLLIEEMAVFREPVALDVWNQASIGAALAAAVLAEEIIVKSLELSSTTQSEFSNFFPNVTALSSGGVGSRGSRKIVGVFDIANLQSLAQLLGVTVPHHTAGRSTAFVGLGSSSYSNGNRCFEILDSSSSSGGAFSGRSDFLPATHTMSPVAQALVVGEDLHRIFGADSVIRGEVGSLLLRIRKPEPAGAAALAGVLLRMLDSGLLSVFEIASTLRFLGFGSASFLELHGLTPSAESEQTFIQAAFEEGPYMGQFAADFLSILDWPIDSLRVRAARQQDHRRSNGYPDRLADSTLVVYLTGDNCEQPNPGLLRKILREGSYDKWSVGE